MANAIKEGTLAIESLAKIVVTGSATLGECVKVLRSRRLIDPGMDKILEGVWAYSGATPGIRHGGTTSPSFAEYDWVIGLSSSRRLAPRSTHSCGSMSGILSNMALDADSHPPSPKARSAVCGLAPRSPY